MTICGSQSCGCALTSSSLTVSGAGTPGSPWIVEQVGFTDLTQLQVDVDNLEALVSVLQADMAAQQTLTTSHTSSISRLDEHRTAFDSGTAVTTVGTTPLVVASSSFTSLTHAGQILTMGMASFTKTVSSDVFYVQCRINAAGASGAGQDRSGAATGWACAFGGPTAVSAGTSPTVDVILTRVGGTGTATTTSGVVRAWFIPN